MSAFLCLQVYRSKARYIHCEGGELWAWAIGSGECNPCALDMEQK